ncbi:MAG TPA: hypothetical protein VMO26_09015 [Vicinamibacterales bacterium]|nr:hypothetical protein [Vicinamibacterales bacterium]
MADDISKKLDELRAQVTERLNEARAILAQMNTVESLFGLPVTSLSDVDLEGPATASSAPLFAMFAPAGTEPRNNLASAPKRRPSTAIRPDEYFGDEPMEAAKKFMRNVGHAVPFDDITDAVQKGGAAIKGADWRERLEISLKRSPYQVITVADKTYGLAEFYTEEQMKRFRGTRRSEPEPAAKKKAKTKAKAKVKTASTAKKPEPATAPAPTKKKAESAPVVEPTSTVGDASEPIH